MVKFPSRITPELSRFSNSTENPLDLKSQLFLIDKKGKLIFKLHLKLNNLIFVFYQYIRENLEILGILDLNQNH